MCKKLNYDLSDGVTGDPPNMIYRFYLSPWILEDPSNGHGIIAALVGGCADFVVLAVVFLRGRMSHFVRLALPL